MPELPEVEVSRLGISPHIEGHQIHHVNVRDSRLRWPVPATVKEVEGIRDHKKLAEPLGRTCVFDSGSVICTIF